jgi:hypothetical protein
MAESLLFRCEDGKQQIQTGLKLGLGVTHVWRSGACNGRSEAPKNAQL